MMEAQEQIANEARERFKGPSKLADAPDYKPDRGPNVAQIWTDESRKKLFSTLVTKEVRENLARIEIEKGGFTRATSGKSDWLAEYLEAKKVKRGDGNPWSPAQMISVLQAFDWAPLPQKGSRKRGGAAAPARKLSPAEAKAMAYRRQLGLLDDYEDDTGADLAAMVAEYRSDSDAIAVLAKDAGAYDSEIRQAQEQINEWQEKKGKILNFVDRKRAQLSDLAAKIKAAGGSIPGADEEDEG